MAENLSGGDPSLTPIVSGNKTADAAVLVACKMLEDGARARQTRFQEIKKNEDQYFGVNTPALRGRSNIPFDAVVMGGFIDTLQSEIRQDIRIAYGHTREQDKLPADKITAVWEREAGPDKGDWDQVYMDTKFLASLSGVGINKLFVEGTPRFKADLTAVDHYDFVCEATGGADIDKHMYKFQMNIFRTRQEMTDNANQGFYDKAQVGKLIVNYAAASVNKQATDLYNNKQIRYATFGIDIASMGYVGQTIYRLTEGVINYNGKWFYIVFSYETKTWVRFEPLENVFAHAKVYPGRGPWTVWHTHRHPFLFWTKAPADDVRPIAYTMKKVINLSIDNLEKRNWDMTAYDPKVFTDPSQLLYKQDGLARATLKQGQNIASGIYKFQTPDTTGITINIIEYLNNFVGQKTGITSDQQGDSNEKRVGILVSNLQQVSKRLKLTNDRFKKSVVDQGVIFDYGVHEHLREAYAVKIIGIKGAQWEEEVTNEDTNCEFSVTVRDADEEDQNNALAAQKRELAFQRLDKHPELAAKINSHEYLRTIFEDAGLDNDKIASMLDVNNDGDADSRAHAAKAIQDCLEGKELYKMYRGATPGFIEKILNYCADNFDLIPDDQLVKMSKGEKKAYMDDMVKYDKLIAYANAHIPIVQKNEERRAVSVIASQANQVLPGAGNSTTPQVPGGPGAIPLNSIAASAPSPTNITQ